ncbi:hypothetical protein A9Q99_08770 [Gammaproteobacteria bacterium 45_16_T64]|nr:hypothetical protein A9Q99_08770 [Gammaproteobacteria bacterium 45_16_T64]
MKLTDSALILAGITASLYCASTAYNHGYIGAFTLDSDVLDRNFHQSIYHGMILSLKLIISIPLAWAGVIYVHSLYVMTLSSYLGKGFAYGRKVVNLKKKIRSPTKKNSPVEKVHWRRIRHHFLVVFVLFIFLLCLREFEKQGRASADKVLAHINADNYTTVKPKDSPETYAYLYCGSRNCAGLKPDTKEIFYFPQVGHSTIKRIPEKQSTDTQDATKNPTQKREFPDAPP